MSFLLIFIVTLRLTNKMNINISNFCFGKCDVRFSYKNMSFLITLSDFTKSCSKTKMIKLQFLFLINSIDKINKINRSVNFLDFTAMLNLGKLVFLLKLIKKYASLCLLSLLSNYVPPLQFVNFAVVLICSCV